VVVVVSVVSSRSAVGASSAARVEMPSITTSTITSLRAAT
jgi:hypothetical protein